jgi:hypothetical protein
MRAISRAIYDGRPQIDERKSTYSQAVRRNLPNTETNPDAEILKGQILAIQAEMNQLRTEREKIRTLEKKVDGLEDSVNPPRQAHQPVLKKTPKQKQLSNPINH